MVGNKFSGARAWVIGGALLGLLSGAAIGELAVRSQTEDEIGTLAATYITRADQVNDEAVSALAEANRSPAPICSDADIARMRQTVIRLQFIKSVARLDGDLMLCGATLGRIVPPVPLAKPDVITADGHRVQFNAKPFGVSDVRAMVIARGAASVIVSKQSYASLVDPRLDYAIVVDVGEHREAFLSSGPPLQLGATPLVSDDALTIDGRRHEVRCSTRHPGCIVATFNTAPALLASPIMQGFALLGLLSGMGGGLGIHVARGWSRSLRRRLRMALRTGDLMIAYQPIVRLADRQLVGAEALLRWKDETGKYVNPDVFIAVAEQSGFISEVTRYVINRTLTELTAQIRQRPNFRLTVNISVEDLMDPSFITFVTRQLKVSGLPPCSLGFEVTERTTAERAQIAKGIERLRGLGHSVYLDDFGTEYSSLSYLADLHIDAIKLDRVFTMHLDEDSNSATIAPQIVAMAKSLGLGLVVEGIEEERQAAYFLQLDPAALGQGWLFGKPMPASRLFDRQPAA
jgi:sensor c-di-GMP phosphodiesterase-like protein